MRIQLLSGKTCLLFVFLGLFTSVSSQTYDYKELGDRVREHVRVGLKNSGVLDAWVASQLANGSWPDLSYGKLTTSNAMNTSDNHVLRLWHLAATVSDKKQGKYNNESYKLAVKRGLEYWCQSKTSDPNWWYNWIYCPQKLGETLLFMREFEGFIPASSSSGIDEAKVLSTFKPQSLSQLTDYGSGANAVDIALHFVYRGILTADGNLLESVRDHLNPILGANIRPDGVYQDHGPQIQISSYGYVFANGLISLASYLAGSPAAFDIQSETFGQVVRFIRETQLSSIRGNQWDFSVMGREVSRADALTAGLNYLPAMAEFIDPEHAEVYTHAYDRIRGTQAIHAHIEEKNKHYWNSDYTQHVRSAYLFTVRNVSTRTVEAETGNNENLKANYFSYGASFISVDGSEYKNIMPYWDWCMIPGTTFPYTTSYPTRKEWGANPGSTSFVGGVSDGLHGASALDMNKGGMKARKAWFFFDDEVVCLGAGISDNTNREVRTTLNQTRMAAQSYIREAGAGKETAQGVRSTPYTHSNLLYLRNGKTAYFFPQQGELSYSMKSQTGRWKDININGSEDMESGYVFTLWFSHGTNPANASYSYVVVPGVDSQAKAEAYDLSAIDIISNTSSIQAVAHKNSGILQIVFYQAGSLTYGEQVYTVDQPCILMVKNGTQVSIADPSQTKSSVNIEIKTGSKLYREKIALPSEEGMKGSSVCIDLDNTSSLGELSGADAFRCFPNPTPDGLVRIHTGFDRESVCEVKNQLGMTIVSKAFQSETTIDLNSQPAGIYYLSLSDGNQQYSRKIIKF